MQMTLEWAISFLNSIWLMLKQNSSIILGYHQLQYSM